MKKIKIVTAVFSFIKKSIDNFDFLSDSFINSIKTAIACFIGICLMKIPGSFIDKWTLISIVVVMAAQVNLGGAIKKSYDRIIGTIAGATVAGITVVFFQNQFIILYAVLIGSALVFSYVASRPGASPQIGALGSTTVIIILLATPPSLHIAFLRAIEIIIGILIALFVTRFIFPIQATVRLKTSLGDTLLEIKKLFLLENNLVQQENSEEIKKVEEELLNFFVKQRALITDTKTEHHKAIKKSILYELFTHIRKLYQAILLGIRILQKNSTIASLIYSLSAYLDFCDVLNNRLENLANILKSSQKNIGPMEPLMFEKLLIELHELSKKQSFKEQLTMDGFIFSLQLIIDETKFLSSKVEYLYF